MEESVCDFHAWKWCQISDCKEEPDLTWRRDSLIFCIEANMNESGHMMCLKEEEKIISNLWK